MRSLPKHKGVCDGIWRAQNGPFSTSPQQAFGAWYHGCLARSQFRREGSSVPPQSMTTRCR